MLSPKEIFHHMLGWTRFIAEIYKPCVKMISLVQDNPEFFRAKIGDSCIERAAVTLERLVGESKNKK